MSTLGPQEAAHGWHDSVIVLLRWSDACTTMHYGTAVAPFAIESEVRAAFRGDRRLQVLVPGEETSF